MCALCKCIRTGHTTVYVCNVQLEYSNTLLKTASAKYSPNTACANRVYYQGPVYFAVLYILYMLTMITIIIVNMYNI